MDEALAKRLVQSMERIADELAWQHATHGALQPVNIHLKLDERTVASVLVNQLVKKATRSTN